MLDGEFFRFEAGALQPCQDQVSEVLLAAADSFLVEDGKVRSLAAHFHRFSAWVSQLAPQLEPQLPAFLTAVTAALPRVGRWFPRIELHGDSAGSQQLFLRLRTAPAQLGPLTLWTLDQPDPRSNPAVKGPDLSLCMQLRRKAQLHSADEAVLLNANGLIIEGALSSLVWWRDQTLCLPDSSTDWLPSVTRNELVQLANSLGAEVRLEAATPDQLANCEVWALSSLQGIRVVNAWVNGPAVTVADGRAALYQRRLRLLATGIE